MKQLLRLLLILTACLAIPACTGQQGNTNNSTLLFNGATGASSGPSSGDVTLSWAPATDLGGGVVTYVIYKGISGAGSEDFSTPAYTTTNATGFVATGLTPGSPFWFIVDAQDASGNAVTSAAEVSASAMP